MAGLVGSLRFRLLVTVAVVVLTAVTVVGLVSGRITTVEFHKFREHSRAAEEQPAFPDGVERRLTEHFGRTGTWRGADRLLATIAREADPAPTFVLLDPENQFAASSSGGLAGATVTRWPDGSFHLTAGGAAAGEEHGINLIFSGDGRSLVDDSGKPIGTLYSLPPLPGESSSPADRFLVTVRRWLIAAVAGAGLLALLATSLLARRIVAPIEALTDASRSMERGDFGQRVEIRGQDEISQLASAFNSMAEGLQRTERLRRQMVTDVAHELRTPLTGLRCQIESIQDGVIDASPGVIASLHDDILALQRLVEDLQDLALVEAGQVRLHRTRIEPQREIETVLRSLPPLPGREHQDRRGEKISVDLGGLPAIDVDRRRFHQIMRNVLANALTHTPPGGSIAVTGRSRSGQVEILVSDEGPGIPIEHLPHVFERFYRADPSRQRGTGGAGLGLAIVKSLVEAHGGQVRASSEPGRGATFSLSFPQSG